MGGTTNFPLGFQNGITLRNVPVEISIAGQVFWVDSTSNNVIGGVDSSNGNPGTYQKPFATLDFAISQCAENRGDVIYLKPGHIETIDSTSAINFDVAGVTAIGLGIGTLQPRINHITAAADVEVNANNISIINVNFHANITSITCGLNVRTGSTDCLIKGCRFDVEVDGTDEFLIAVNTDINCNRTIIEDNIVDMGLGNSSRGLGTSSSAGITIRHNRIVGNFSVANITGDSGLSTEVYIEDNLLIQGSTGNLNPQPVIEMVTGTTGVIRNNDIVCDVVSFAAQTVADTMSFINNQRTDDISQSKTSNDTSGTVTVSTDG